MRRLDVVSGQFDTDDGIALSVIGESFPRVMITIDGMFLGDGTETPRPILGPRDVEALELFFDSIGYFLVPEGPRVDNEFVEGTFMLTRTWPPPNEGSTGLSWVPVPDPG